MTGASPSAEPSRLRRAVSAAGRNLGWLLASRGVLAVLSLFYLGICTRTLGIEGFGRFALIATASQTLALIVGFQTWQIVVQYGVDHVARRDEGALARLLRACALLDLFSAVLGSVLGAAILLLWGDAFGITPALMRDTIIFVVVQLVTIRSMPLGILRLRDRFSLAAIADSMTPVIRFVGAWAAVFLLPTVQGFLYSWAAAEMVTAAAYWVCVARTGDLTPVLRADGDWRRVRAENPGIFRFALSTNANATLGLSGKQLPLLLVGATIGPLAAGGFRLAAQLAQALAKLSQLLTRAAFPEIVRTIREAGSAFVAPMLARLFAVSALAALVILLVLVAGGRELLVLVGGKAFGDAYPILIWLALAGCVDLATVGFEPVLLALHRAGTAFAIRAAAVLVMVASALALLPVVGANGAAIAVFVGSLVTGLLQVALTFGVVRRQAARDAVQ